MLDWQAWYTIVVVALTFVGLVGGLPTDGVLLAAMVLVGVAGIVSPEEMFAGFSNHGVLTVAALFVVASGLRETGALDRIGRLMLGRVKSERRAMLTMAAPVTALSAFLNNTAVVAMLVSVVSDWCRKHRISPSKLLLPLSYMTMLGGVCTLIGTSTNLIISGLMTETAATTDDPTLAAALGELSLFEIGKVGLPCALVGLLYLRFVGRRLLPDRKDLLEQFGESLREYLANMRIEAGSPLIGKGVEAAGLRRLPGLFLVEIERDGQIIAPVEPNEILREGDQLTFTGAVNTIVDLERIPGFVPVESTPADTVAIGAERRYCEAVVSGTSPLQEQTIRDANFRARYNAAVIAVHRGGTRLRGRVGDIVLRQGDTLLLQAGPHFASAYRNDPGFFLVSAIDEARPVKHDKAILSLALLAGLIVLLALPQVPTVLAAFLVAGVLIATRCISMVDARRTIAYDVLLTIAASFALGKALENSGVAAAVAGQLVDLTGPLGPIAALAAIYLITTLATETISNNAAAVLMFPFAIATATQLDLNPRPFAIVVAVAASCSFATPIGYQTNMMVYGPGGYRFTDFLRVGIPLNILMWITVMLVVPWAWPLA